MEAMGAMCYSLDEMLSDEADFMSRLLENSCYSINNNNVTCNEATAGSSSNLWQLAHETGFMYGSLDNFPFPADDHVMTSMDHDHHMMVMSEEESNKSMSHEDEVPVHVESKKKRGRIHGDVSIINDQSCMHAYIDTYSSLISDVLFHCLILCRFRSSQGTGEEA